MSLVPNPLSAAKAAATAKLTQIKADAAVAESKVITFAKKYWPVALGAAVAATRFLK